MRSCSFWAVAGLAVVLAYGCHAQQLDESDVVVLSGQNFSSCVRDNPYVLVKMVASWCGHCQKLRPEYAKAATALKAANSPVVLATVDAVEEEDLAKEHSVQGYPSLFWYVNGERKEFTGGRTEQDIVRWIAKKTGPAAQTIASEEELEEVKEGHEVFLLGYFDNFEGDGFAAFESVAGDSELVPAFQTSSAEVAKAAGIEASAPTFVVGTSFGKRGYKAFPSEGHKAFAAGAPLVEQLGALLQAEQLPPVMEFEDNTRSAIFEAPRQVFVIGPKKEVRKAAKIIEEVQPGFKGEIAFVVSRKGHSSYEMLANYFDVDKEAKEAQVYGFVASANKKFTLKEELSTESLQKFARDFVGGVLKGEYKSAEPPEEPKENGVTIVVGTTVDAIVKDPSKDVLLEIYAPWCGHCKKLAPTYEELAESLEDETDVVIAKMDGVDNEHEDIDAQGFPTILFFPAEEDAAPVAFSGDRTVQGFRSFLVKHSKRAFAVEREALAREAAKREAELLKNSDAAASPDAEKDEL